VSLQAIREHLVAATSGVDALLQPPPPLPPAVPTVDVRPGDNLLDTIAQAPAGAIIRVDKNWEGDVGQNTIAKPVRIQGNLALGPGRVAVGPIDGPGPILRNAALTFAAPNIQLAGVIVVGQGGTIITAGDGTLLDQVALVGRGDRSQHRGVMANAANVLITRSHIGDIWHDIDTQAVGCFVGTRNLIIRDCFLEASGENFMAGGDDGPNADSIPDGILIEDCTLYKPRDKWTGRGDIGIKNLLELKNCKNFVGRRLILENSWADAQSGYAIVLTIRNQYGRAPWSTIENVLLEDLTIRHVGSGLSVLGRDDRYPSQVMKNVVCRRWTIEDLSWAHKEPGVGAHGTPFAISGGPDGLVLEDIDALVGNSWKHNAGLMFNQHQHLCTNLQFRRCRIPEGYYGITGSVPNVAVGAGQLEAHAPGFAWEEMTAVKLPFPTWPTPPGTGRRPRWPVGTTIEWENSGL